MIPTMAPAGSRSGVLVLRNTRVSPRCRSGIDLLQDLRLAGLHDAQVLVPERGGGFRGKHVGIREPDDVPGRAHPWTWAAAEFSMM